MVPPTQPPTYATTTQPVDPQAKPGRCAHCGAEEVRTVYEHNDGMQFYSTTTWETYCTACRVYEVHEFQAPG